MNDYIFIATILKQILSMIKLFQIEFQKRIHLSMLKFNEVIMINEQILIFS